MVTSSFMKVIMQNEVREHNNTIFSYLVGKDIMLLKQAAAVTACAEVAGSWGANFMRVQGWRNRSGSLRQLCGHCSFPVTSLSVRGEVTTLPRAAEAFTSRRKRGELWHPKVYPLVIAASSACSCVLASDKVRSCFPCISCPGLFSLFFSGHSLFPSHSLYLHMGILSKYCPFLLFVCKVAGTIAAIWNFLCEKSSLFLDTKFIFF